MTCWSSFLQKNLSQIQNYLPNTWKHPLTEQNFSLLKQKSQLESFSFSLKAFAHQGDLFNAFKTYSLLQTHLSSSTYSYSLLVLHSISSLLSCCNTLITFSQGKQLHAHVITLGFIQNPVLVPKIVTLYTNFGFLSNAHVIVLNSINGGSVVGWNLLISASVKNGLCKEALFAYKQMVELGVKPDKFTYPSVLKACSNEFDLGFGREVHRCIDHSYIEQDLFVQNGLVTMYVKCGELTIAQSLFDKMPVRDVVSWNTMIDGYASRGMWECAFELFERMRIGNVGMNTVTWNTIAGGCLQTRNYRGALELIPQMRDHGVGLDCVTVVIGLGACSQNGFLKIGKEIHGYAVWSHYNELEFVKNALIIIYSRCNDLTHARVLFRSTKAKSLITWNSMITGCIHLDQYEEATFIFREMLFTRVKPNYVTIASILPYCARTMNLLHGKEIHCNIVKQKELKDCLLLWNSVVDFYCKSGKMFEAQRVFDSINEKDKISYTSLIAGYGMQREGQTALKLFEEMNMYKIKPDHITMIAVLSACSHSGLVFEGQIVFDRMIKVYRLYPQMEHFACMVDLYGATGFIRKAAEIIIEMPFRPSRAMLATLIRACRIHGNTTIMEWALQLLKTRPQE